MEIIGWAEAMLTTATKWEPMNSDRYAAFQAHANYARVRKHSGIWWRGVRPFFYRPILPYQRYNLDSVRQSLSYSGVRSVFQHAVNVGQHFNSHLNLLIYDNLRGYEISQLSRCARRNLGKGMESGIELRWGIDRNEFLEKGYPVLQSFCRRSAYGLAKKRNSPPEFSKYVEALFEFPEVKIIVAFKGKELLAFETSCLVDNVLVLLGMVHSERGLQLRTPDLIQHLYRQTATHIPEIKFIYDGMVSRNHNINRFKLSRGARILPISAFLHANSFLLKLCAFLPVRWRRILGY